MRALLLLLMPSIVGCGTSGAPCPSSCPTSCDTAGLCPLSPTVSGSGGGGGASSGGGGGSTATGGGTMGPLTSEVIVSGSRLKALVRVDDSGGESLRRWKDTQLDVSCSFQIAGDGQLRCLPNDTIAYVTPGLFSDAACTRPAVQLATAYCGGTVRHAYAYDENVCPIRRRFYGLTGPLQQSQLFYKSGTDCVASSRSSTVALYAVGAELPPSSFVSGTLTTGSGRIGLNIVTAADGAKGPNYELQDQQLGIPCWASIRSDGRVQCLPSEVAYPSGWFSDANCRSPAFSSGSCRPDAAMASGTGAGCYPDREFFAVGATLPRPYNSSGSMCVAQDALPGSPMYAAGALMPAAGFATATITRTSLGRLERRVLEWPGGMRMVRGWHDTQLDVDCSYYSAWDGSARCVPETIGVNSGSYFSDAQCSQPLAYAQNQSGCNPRYAMDAFDLCRSRAKVLRVGAVYSGPVYSGGAGSCRPSAAPQGVLFVTLGELPPDQMAPLNETLR